MLFIFKIAMRPQDKIICVKLCGGLGNQMFQYASGRALALRLGVELKLDTAWFSTKVKKITQRAFMLEKAFPAHFSIASDEECAALGRREESITDRLLRKILGRSRAYTATYVREPHFAYWPGFERLEAPVYLSGYWQNETYFKAVGDTIRKDFSFSPFVSEETRELVERTLANPKSIAVHIRRRDYVENPLTNSFHGVCGLEYYQSALNTIAEKINASPSLFIFTDDPVWVRENFETCGYPSSIVDIPQHKDEPWNDMHLMSLCRHHIIANSSFSWWGAWLSEEKGVICAPKRWFVQDKNKNDSPVPERWITL
jgi:hypothetical protein